MSEVVQMRYNIILRQIKRSEMGGMPRTEPDTVWK
jgi:hypothetical protein